MARWHLLRARITPSCKNARRMKRNAGRKIQKIEKSRVVKSQKATATPESSRKSFAYPNKVSRALNFTSLTRSNSNLRLYSRSAFCMFEEGVGMRLARAAQFSQRNRKCGGKGSNCRVQLKNSAVTRTPGSSN